MSTHSYIGLKIKQRSTQTSPTLFTFYAPASEIMLWTRVERAEENTGGVQRILRSSRLSGIRRFLAKDSNNILPNNILVAFPEGETNFTLNEFSCRPQSTSSAALANGITPGVIQITTHEEDIAKRPALVIDGQHRLFGASSYTAEDIPILVVAILDAKPEEMAFQFIVINNKSVKVPTSLVKSLVANYSDIEQGLAERLITAGITYGNKSAFLTAADNSDSSPFAGFLNWENNRAGERIIDITTIEAMHSYLKRELSIILSGDDDSSQSIFFAIWQTIKERYTAAWSLKWDNFFRKVNMLAMNEYVIDRIRNLASMQMVNIFDDKSIKTTVERTFAFIPEELWEMDWSSIRLQDNKAIRDLIKNSFEIIANNKMHDRDWHHSVKLLTVE